MRGEGIDFLDRVVCDSSNKGLTGLRLFRRKKPSKKKEKNSDLLHSSGLS